MKYLIIGCIAVLFIAACCVILGVPIGIGIYFFGIVGQTILFIIGIVLTIAFIFWVIDKFGDQISDFF